MAEEGKDNTAELYQRIVELSGRLHDQEVDSADNMATRAGTFIGFAGLVLTLTVALSREAFGRAVDLGSVGDPASAAMFLLAVLFLLAAAVQGVRAARPWGRSRVNPRVFETYRDELPSVSEADEHFGRKQQGVAERLATSNRERARTLQWGFRWLGVGVCLVAGQAVIIGVDRLVEVLEK